MSDTENVSQFLALRREARRKRILENSANRLKLIEGVISSTSISAEKKIRERPQKPEVRETEHNELQNVPNDENLRESESNSKPNDLFKYEEPLNQVPIFNLKRGNEDKEEEVEEEEEEEEDNDDDDDVDYDDNYNEEEREIRNREEQKHKSYIGVVFEKRLHYVLLACLVNLMFFYNVGFLIYENIFCPFYTIKIIEWLAGGQKKKPMTPMMLFLMAGLPKYAQRFIVTVYRVTSALLSDLCIYIFSFVMGTKLIYTET